MNRAGLTIGVMVFCLAGGLLQAADGEQAGPKPLPSDAPRLTRDVTVVIAGSSISVNRYLCEELPKWTGGYDRMPPMAYGQNVFFRVFEMLNDHENMCWRRLSDRDWIRRGEWKGETKWPYSDAYYGRCVRYVATSRPDYAELAVPAGYEKIELIYGTDPNGDRMKVSIDGQPPAENAVIDTHQTTDIAPGTDLGPDMETLDSHGETRQLPRPKKGISHLELRVRYALDPAKTHVLRVERATDALGKRIVVWGAVYWRGNCVLLVQRAKGGINCGDLPNYTAVQEVMAAKPDYLLMEAINIRDKPADVLKSFEAAYGWCAQRVKKGQFKMLVYATPQASSKTFRKWFSDPAHKPPYGTKDALAACSDENADACAAVVVDLCRKHGFPMVDVGPAVDAWIAKNPAAQFVPHVLNDWYHPNQWGAAIFGRTLFDGIQKAFPEIPIRPVNFPEPPPGKAQ